MQRPDAKMRHVTHSCVTPFFDHSCRELPAELARGHGGLDWLEEADELLVSVLRYVLTDPCR
jgi:hypothetical protein